MSRLADFPFDPVRFKCRKCDRRGQYRKSILIERFGPDQNTVDLLAIISADCPRQLADKISDQCGCVYADLDPK